MLQYSMLYPRQSVSRRTVSMDGMWKFRLDPEGKGTENGWTDGIPESKVMRA